MSNLFSLSYSNKKNPANLWDEKTIAFIILSLDEARHIFVTKRWKLQEVIGRVLRVLLSYSIRVAQWVRSLDLTTHTSLSPIRYGFSPGIVNYKKGCTRLATTSDKVYQLLAHNRWFSPGIPASSTTKTGRHDIVEILLKVALKPQKSINLIVLFWGGRRQKLSIVWSPTVNVYKRTMIMIVKHFLYMTCKSVRGSYNPVSWVWFYQLQIF